MSCLFKDLELKNKLQDYILFSFFLVDGTSFPCALLSIAEEMTWEKQKLSFLFNSVNSLPLLSFLSVHLCFLRYGFACLELSV